MATKGTWVQIEKTLLLSEERSSTLPDVTKKTPFSMWVKGFLLFDALLGDECSIETVTGRHETGKLVRIEPSYEHNFGTFVPELLEIDKIVKNELFGGDTDGTKKQG